MLLLVAVAGLFVVVFFAAIGLFGGSPAAKP
jgi:hypothetical protein